MHSGENLIHAPNSKLIFYSKYPEARISGFLRNAPGAPKSLMNARLKNRIFILGIFDDHVVCFVKVCTDGELIYLRDLKLKSGLNIGSFYELNIGNQNQKIIERLNEIVQKEWIPGSKLDKMGLPEPYNARNAIGYTLEAELKIKPNPISSPDFDIWEVKGSTISTEVLKRIYVKPYSMFDSAPDLGIIRSIKDSKKFAKTYGREKNNRYDFTGPYKYHEEKFGRTLRLLDEKDIYTHLNELLLFEGKIKILGWSFEKIINHLSSKHSHTVFAFAQMQKISGIRHYKYNPVIILAEYAGILGFIDSLLKKHVYYDPDCKYENNRTHFRHLIRGKLTYDHLDSVFQRFSIWNVLNKTEVKYNVKKERNYNFIEL